MISQKPVVALTSCTNKAKYEKNPQSMIYIYKYAVTNDPEMNKISSQ